MLHFVWDQNKNRDNIAKHKIDFTDVDVVFESKESVVFPSPRGTEPRFVIVGRLGTRLISVVYTLRGDMIRIISARAAREKEKALWRKQTS